MKERPILFSGPMVRAILEGRKTQTRRIVKPTGAHHIFQFRGREEARGTDEPTGEWAWCRAERVISEHIRCPYGKPGDRLWVREAWRVGKPHDKIKPSDILDRVVTRGQGVTVLYEVGGWKSFGPPGRMEPVYSDDQPMPAWAGKYRPSLFMPSWASRITLEITDVRAERLQSISESDAHAEGAIYGPLLPMAWSKPNCESDDACMRSRFAALWDRLNATRGYGWDVNPWVWTIEFRRIEL